MVLCSSYLRKERVPLSELSPRELLSEVWLKLLGTVSLDETEEFTTTAAPEWSVDHDVPERDGRVEWWRFSIYEAKIGGPDADPAGQTPEIAVCLVLATDVLWRWAAAHGIWCA